MQARILKFGHKTRGHFRPLVLSGFPNCWKFQPKLGELDVNSQQT